MNKVNKDRRYLQSLISQKMKFKYYPTDDVFKDFENYVEAQRLEALGWMYAEACLSLDNNEDIRKKEVPELIERARQDLTKE